MVKVSITLPNATQITLESEEPEVMREVVRLALRDLPNDLMLGYSNGSAGAGADQEWEKSSSVVQIVAPEYPDPPEAPGVPGVPRAAESDQAFSEFCRGANPVGDMRRVAVAAEGAQRYLGMASIDASELATLFSMAGWPLPHSFTQTLRNAARDKFQWLERVPGRAGRYFVTDRGRAVTLG